MCGIVGVYQNPRAVGIGAALLHSIQHRGQESVGITSIGPGGSRFCEFKDLGLVLEVFTEEALRGLAGATSCIGHTRYSTAGSCSKKNAQPLTVHTIYGEVALAHNGNLTNAAALRQRLEKDSGAAFQTDSDSEVILQLIAHSGLPDFRSALRYALTTIQGAFALVLMHAEALYAVCDPYQFRPLWLGKYDGSFVLSSEDCAFDGIGAQRVRELEPGEILEIGPDGLRSEFLQKAPRLARCIFEHVYFARPDSTIFGRAVYASREMLGRQLAIDSPVEADIVVPIPDSGVGAAVGFAQQLGLPLRPQGIIRDHYVGRTFIDPDDGKRDGEIRLKHSPLRWVIEGKRVVLVDDSIVRGATSKQIVRLVRERGATEVHLRVSSPPIISSCFWGIDTPTREELIAYSLGSVEAVREYIGADSLGYLDTDGLLRAVGAGSAEFCTSCFTGECPVDYPVEQLVQLG